MAEEGGEELLKEFLSAFSTEKEKDGAIEHLNPDIESFLKDNALSFARQKTSVSYIVTDEEDGAILGYFTIAHKSLDIPADGLSKTTMKKMSRYGTLNKATNSYTVSAFLLAQFGKNYGVDDGKRISGKALMTMVDDVLTDIQHRIGGGIEYLDCEAHAGLINFYESEGFRLFGERISEKDNKRYLQYMKFI